MSLVIESMLSASNLRERNILPVGLKTLDDLLVLVDVIKILVVTAIVGAIGVTLDGAAYRAVSTCQGS